VKEIIREVSASADDVLAAMREDAREWRESAIPPVLRKRGVVRVEARIRPPYVELRLRFGTGEREPGAVVLRAAVIPSPAGGARIRGECGRRNGSLVAGAIVLVALVAGVWFGGDFGSGVAVSAFALFGFAMMLIRHLGPRDGVDVEADYLMQRFEHALAVAEEKALANPAITPARRP
jgi:hypothetical protein